MIVGLLFLILLAILFPRFLRALLLLIFLVFTVGPVLYAVQHMDDPPPIERTTR